MMATKLINPSILNSRKWCIKPILQNLQIKKIHSQTPVKEITIPVKWGHISAKLWGNENEQPILALHGWQDNAGTWDTLAPTLSKKRPILAIDLPGHGLSSWIPAGMQYYPWDLPRLILHLKDYFKWEKISLLTHSMGSIAGMRFASVFPDCVDFFIAFDSLIYDDYDFKQVVHEYPRIFKKMQLIQELKGEPPCYTLEEIAKVWHLGTDKSVTTESAKLLLKRGSKPSSKESNKFYFSRDPRLKVVLFSVEDKEFTEALVRRLKCPTLYFKSIYSRFGIGNYAVEMRDIVARNNSDFECHFIAGTHHVHLNNPELVEPTILNFLGKYNFIN